MIWDEEARVSLNVTYFKHTVIFEQHIGAVNIVAAGVVLSACNNKVAELNLLIHLKYIIINPFRASVDHE